MFKNHNLEDPRDVFLAEALQKAYGTQALENIVQYSGMSPEKYAACLHQSRTLRETVFPPANSWKLVKEKGRVIFRTLYYTPTEIPYIIMNLIESSGYVDLFLIVEANVTHVGEKRDFNFEQHSYLIPKELRDKFIYIPADLTSVTADASLNNDGNIMHRNEYIMLNCFENYIEINDEDIIIAPDADEVIYRTAYPRILSAMLHHNALVLPLNQFFYRMNYLWQDVTCWALQVTRAKFYKNSPRPCLWRYEAPRYPFIVGTHFSWQLTIEQMLFKLKTYAHKDIYGQYANPELLRRAVEDKKYPFEPDRPFTIRELDLNSPVDRQYYPKSFFVVKPFFTHLLPNEDSTPLAKRSSSGQGQFDLAGTAAEDLRSKDFLKSGSTKIAAIFENAISCMLDSFGGWALAKSSLRYLIFYLLRGRDESPVRVVELGGGMSTRLWGKLCEHWTSLNIMTLEHDEAFANALRDELCSPHIRIEQRKLVQYSDADWRKIFSATTLAELHDARISSRPKDVSINEYHNTRIKNSFYDTSNIIDFGEPIDALVVDGPHGNGRSMAFAVFAARLKSGSLVLIDDASHYPFMDHLALFASFSILEASHSLEKQWILLEVNSIIQ